MKTFFKLFAYCIAFIAVGTAVAFLVYKILNFEKTGEVPILIGLSITESAEMLNSRKLFLRIEGKNHHDDIKAGSIIEQNLKAGEKVNVGTEVGVIVSKGPEMFSMPSFEEQALKDAKLTLLNLGMKIRKVTWVHSDTVKKGRIIAQRPLPGNIASNEMNFLVSLGPYDVSYKCPSFVNMTIDDAKILAKELGITLAIKKQGSRVIFQKPEAETLISKGDNVEITLGRGWGMWF